MNKDEALTLYEDKMSFRNLSPKTIKMYKFYLSKYFDDIGKDDLSSLTIDDAIRYVADLKNSGKFEPQSLNIIISTIRCFNELVLDICVSKSKFPLVRFKQNQISIFSDEEIQMLLDHADLRLKTMIFLGIDCGLRVSEVANLKISDIHSKEGFILIRESKRGKSRKIKLSNQCLHILRRYWSVYRPIDYFFPSSFKKKAGQPITASYINSLFRNLLKELNLSQDYHFHSLRHTYATHMLEDDCDIFLLKKLLGHNSFSSTARYVHLTSHDIKSSFSPSDKRGYTL